jgi:HlyD family secretion protein
MAMIFDQPVILRRSPVWSRLVVWSLMGVTSFSIAWACLARMDEAVFATGKLEPKEAVREIKVPLNGVVQEVHVKDGDTVQRGEALLTLDRTAESAQLNSLQKVRAALVAEISFYRSQLQPQSDTAQAQSALAALPPEMLALTKSRAALLDEIQLYWAQLNGSSEGRSLSAEQRLRLRSNLSEQSSRTQASQLEVNQLQRQRAQAQGQLAAARQVLQVNQGIFKDLVQLVQQGGIARVQYLRQQQEVTTNQSRVNELVQEVARLQFAIDQARQRLQNTVAVTQDDLLTKMATNEKQVAEIESQLNKVIVENQKRIAEIDSQLGQTKQVLRYREVKAPVTGKVFALKAFPGFVATPQAQDAVVLKLVPQQALVVQVYIPNKDIGFVRAGMPVDVRIDAFPFSEFGDIKGEVVSVGSDALPPTEIRPFYSFPAQIQLAQQALQVGGQKVGLQSGMSVSVNIKVRQRTVLSLFTDKFMRQVDQMRSVR